MTKTMLLVAIPMSRQFAEAIVANRWEAAHRLLGERRRDLIGLEQLRNDFVWDRLEQRLAAEWEVETGEPFEASIGPPARFEVFPDEERDVPRGIDSEEFLGWTTIEFHPANPTPGGLGPCYRCSLAIKWETEGARIAIYEIHNAWIYS